MSCISCHYLLVMGDIEVFAYSNHYLKYHGYSKYHNTNKLGDSNTLLLKNFFDYHLFTVIL